MSKRNCPNCGAPYDVELNKCPFCGTSYFDMSAIDLDNREPIFLKIKVNGYTITQKCIPTVGEVSFEPETTDIVDSYGNFVKRFYHRAQVTTNIEFRGIPMGNKEVFRVETNGEDKYE